MPYIFLHQIWQIAAKTTHDFRLEVREGIFIDRGALYVDDELVLRFSVGVMNRRGVASFQMDGRVFELRWLWGFWSGNPRSIVVTYKDKILGQIGTDEAATMDFTQG